MEWFLLFLIFIYFAWSSLPREEKTPSLFSTKIREIFGADLRSLALYRVCLGILLLLETIFRATDIEAFYTDNGLVPRVLSFQYSNIWSLSLHMLSGKWEFQAFLFLVQGMFAFFLVFGFRTRLSTFISWLLLVSVQNRNQIIIDAGDFLLRLILFWSIFLPLGAFYSIDSAFSKKSDKCRKEVYSIGTLGYFLQIAFMYWFSVVLKLGNTEWTNGTALLYILKLNMHAQPLAFELLKLPENTLKLVTKSVLLFEEFGPLLLFSPIYKGPIRTLVVLGFFIMHFGFGLTLDLENFPWISSIAMLPFIPSWFWEIASPQIVGFINRRVTFLNQCELRKFLSHIISKNYEFWTRVVDFIPFTVPGIVPMKFSNLVACSCLIYIFSINLMTVNASFKIPDKLQWFGPLLRIDQRWGMFIAAEKIGWYSGWFVFPGKLKNGEKVDIFRSSEQVTFDIPKLQSAMYKSHHWKRYFVNVFTDGNYFSNIAYCGDYFCKKWNSTHSLDEQLEEISFYFMKEEVLPNYKISEPKKMLVSSYKCFGESGTSDEIVKDIEERFKENGTLIYWEILRVGGNRFSQGKYAEAEEFYKKALEIKEKTSGSNSKSLIQDLKYLSVTYLNQNKLEEAKQVERRIECILTGKPYVQEGGLEAQPGSCASSN